MNHLDFSWRLMKGAYRITRIVVIGLSVLLVLCICAFTFLRIYGVPDPLLREAMRRVNAAGIPVAVEGITLTLHGWRADQVRYYSANPDDLAPLFLAEHVFFSVRNSRLRRAGSTAFSLDVRAVEMVINPSVEWGVDIPPDSGLKHVEQAEASLTFHPDRVEIAHGRIDWLGSQFNLSGMVLKGSRKPDPARLSRIQTLFPKQISARSVQRFEELTGSISLSSGAVVNIEFSIDAADYAASRVHLEVRTDGLSIRQAEFSGLEIAGSYAYPTVSIEQARILRGSQSLQLSGDYNLDTGQAEGVLRNSITSGSVLQLLPDGILDQLLQAELNIGNLPRLEIEFGPSSPKNLINHITGTFSIHNVGYKGLVVESLKGHVKRENNRIDFTQLQGSVLGQEERAAAVGSAMHGGTAAGSVFWDGNTREFGVEADTNFDPSLLLQPLAFVEIATNIISRFKCNDRPPQAHVSLGANVDDWGTFYINIRGQANNASFQGVEFSSINLVQTYKEARLNLDPAVGMQGAQFIKGYAHMDFRKSTVTFDAVTSISPADLEDLIYPDLNLFGHHIATEGDVRIEAGGTFDWKRMEHTDFTAKVETQRLEIPIAAMDDFSAEVIGEGSVINVNDASFGLYGGEGRGRFVQHWNPPRKELPYEIEMHISGADFQQCLAFLYGDRPVSVSGVLEGNALVRADFSTNFFNVANGGGFVRVDNGQLADLPLFHEFSRLMRKVFPSFTVFSITNLRGGFALTDGVISSEDAYFDGNLLSAKGRGRYVHPTGFDAYVQTQVFREGRISRIVRVFTDPLLRLLELKLEGPLSNPSWKLQNF